MKCQVTRPPSAVALQGQFLARYRREMGGTRGVLRVGAMVDLCLPRVRVCRRVGSGVDANSNPGTWIACNQTARCNRGAKTWPYRPKGTAGPVSRDCIPGWWTWPYRPDSQTSVRRRAGDVNPPVTARHRAASAAANAHEGVTGRLTSTACHRTSFKKHPVAFPACKASSISLA